MNIDHELTPRSVGVSITTSPIKPPGSPWPSVAWSIGVTLSRSNLENMLAKLDTPGSACTMLRQVQDDPKVIIVLRVEEDDVHYHARERQADVRAGRGRFADGTTETGQFVAVPASVVDPKQDRGGDPFCGGNHESYDAGAPDIAGRDLKTQISEGD